MPSRPEMEAAVRAAIAKSKEGYSIDDHTNIRDRGGFVYHAGLADVLLALEETKKWNVEYSATHRSVSLYRRDKFPEVLVERVSWEPSAPLSGQSADTVGAIYRLLKKEE
jgi:hypothetical protein